MPTKREREYYAMGFRDGAQTGGGPINSHDPVRGGFDFSLIEGTPKKKKRKLSAWNKYVKANSKKPRFRYRNGKLNLKKMAIAFRKTPAGRKKRR
jgi:hypothetical protein